MKFLNIIRGLILSKIFLTPFYVHLFATERCNLRCKMCSIWKRGDEKKEMSLLEIEKTAKILKKLKVPQIVITGGEPLMRKDIVDIVKILSKYGFSVRLQTNSILLTEEKLDQLVKAGLNDLTTSLDSLDSKKLDSICNSTNLLKKVSKLLEFAPRKLKRGIVVVNTVISHQNTEEIPEIIKFVTKKGAYSSIVPISLAASESESFYAGPFTEQFTFSKKDLLLIDKIYSQILEMKKEGYNIITSTKFLKDSIKALKTNNLKWECKAGKLFFVIHTDGSIAPCGDFPSLLHIKKDFLKNFKSREYNQKVKKIQKSCVGCMIGCWREISYFITDFRTQLEQLKIYIKNISKK